MNIGETGRKSTLFMIASLCLLGLPAQAASPKHCQAQQQLQEQQTQPIQTTKDNSLKAGTKEIKSPANKLSSSVFETTIKAPKEIVWAALTDFNRYPQIFPRMKSCQILKREGSLVYLETILKPQMFVKQECQHTINDLAGEPDILHWRMIDGNFKSVEGEWRLKPSKDKQGCLVSYTLKVDPGPIIPKPMAVMALKMVQKEIVVNIKQVIEKGYTSREQVAKISDSSSSVHKPGNNLFLNIKSDN
jgi:ribosome-associated toxin RatA of RatAB toxin-antitoxin module